MAFELSQLNEEQLRPVLDTEGAVLVSAGAGSGKTRLLTHRIAHLVMELGVPAYNILAITFTNKAAAEMKARLYSMIPQSHGLWVSTFHSMCVSILRKFAEHIGYSKDFSVYGEQEKDKLIKKLVEGLGGDLGSDFCKEASYRISSAKNDGLSPDEFLESNPYMHNVKVVYDVYCGYEKELKRCNAMDFDDLLFKAHLLLESSADARIYYQERFKYIHVDEFQDTNTIQYNLVKILSDKHKNVMVVGDEDQSIYGWRGANIENIRNFIKDFSCRVYKLEQNYRSSKTIIALANKLIKNNRSRIDKTLWTDNGQGVKTEYYEAYKDTDEADYVVNLINGLVTYSGYSYSDIAVLIRINALTRTFEQRFLQYGIPYKVFGGFKFFERKEVKDIIAYLRLVSNPSDNEAVLRVINFPKRGIGESTVKQLENYSLIKNQSLFQTLVEIGSNNELPLSVVKKVVGFSDVIRSIAARKDDLRVHELIVYIVKLLNLEEVYSEKTEENENRMAHLAELVNSAKEFSDRNESADLSDFLQMVTLYTDLDQADDKNNFVSLATVHTVKGLEFKAVFVVGLEDGIFPISRASSDEFELEEERRLMYVAITRAKERLFCSRTKLRYLYGNLKDALPSRFLSELGFIVSREAAENAAPVRKYSEAVQQQSIAPKTSYSENRITPDKTKSEVLKFQTGMKIKHKRFGVGTILNITQTGNYYAEIDFDVVGKVTLALNYAPIEIVR